MKQLLIIGYVWPEPNSSAAGTRMLQLIHLFLSQDWNITYASPASESEFAIDFEKLGISVKQIKPNDSDFDKFLKKVKPNAVMFDRFMMEEQFGWRVVQQCPEAIRILDTEDLHFFRKARYAAFKKGRSLQKSDLQSDEARREIASILRCDLSLIISEAERDLLVEKFQLNPEILLYLPFLLPPISTEETKTLPTFEERSDFVFIGNFLHQPNWDAVLYIKKLWPEIRKELPKVKIHIYGAYTTAKVKQLQHKKSGFLVEGRTENAAEVFKNARILLAPLRFGAGIKGKFIEGMLNGTPSITTTIGAEGICGKFPWNGEIANDEKSLVREAVNLYQKPKRWRKAQESGFNIINNRFQESAYAPGFFNKIGEIQTDLQKHRSKNFMGSLLMQHTLQSTKYMSLWIEAKNKLKDQTKN